MKTVGMKGGIYAIMVDDEIIYIGKALNNLETRYKQHKYALNGTGDRYGKLYDLMEYYKEQGHHVWFNILIRVEDLCVGDKNIDERELELMELALIHEHQPIGNIQGVSRLYNLIPRK